MTIPVAGWVAPFGYPRINACSRLPVAFRSVPRPSSPPGAKASTECPSYTRYPGHPPKGRRLTMHRNHPQFQSSVFSRQVSERKPEPCHSTPVPAQGQPWKYFTPHTLRHPQTTRPRTACTIHRTIRLRPSFTTPLNPRRPTAGAPSLAGRPFPVRHTTERRARISGRLSAVNGQSKDHPPRRQPHTIPSTRAQRRTRT